MTREDAEQTVERCINHDRVLELAAMVDAMLAAVAEERENIAAWLEGIPAFKFTPPDYADHGQQWVDEQATCESFAAAIRARGEKEPPCP